MIGLSTPARMCNRQQHIPRDTGTRSRLPSIHKHRVCCKASRIADGWCESVWQSWRGSTFWLLKQSCETMPKARTPSYYGMYTGPLGIRIVLHVSVIRNPQDLAPIIETSATTYQMQLQLIPKLTWTTGLMILCKLRASTILPGLRGV